MLTIEQIYQKLNFIEQHALFIQIFLIVLFIIAIIDIVIHDYESFLYYLFSTVLIAFSGSVVLVGKPFSVDVDRIENTQRPIDFYNLHSDKAQTYSITEYKKLLDYKNNIEIKVNHVIESNDKTTKSDIIKTLDNKFIEIETPGAIELAGETIPNIYYLPKPKEILEMDAILKNKILP